MKTGTTIDCARCGAINVPMSWNWRTYSHTPGIDWNVSPNGRGRRVCLGESADDSFLRLLRNAELALAGDGMRLMSDAEIAAVHDAETSGHLF